MYCLVLMFHTSCIIALCYTYMFDHWPSARMQLWHEKNNKQLECGPMPNVMAALPNIGGALCSTPQSGWHPLLECCAVMLPRRETRWNLQGCPKLANGSQPLVGQSSPYYEDMWRRYRCLTSFFRLSIHSLAAKIQPDKVVRRCQNGDFLHPVFSASRLQHISDMHSKFALRPHHV